MSDDPIDAIDPVVLIKNETMMVLMLDDGDLAIFLKSAKIAEHKEKFIRESPDDRMLFTKIMADWKAGR